MDPDDQDCRTNCGNNLKYCNQDKVRPGYFEAIDPDDQFDNLTEIIISKADKSNEAIDWSGVLDEGDYLEVDHILQGQLDKTNYGLYRVTDEPELSANSYGEPVYTMKLQFLQGDGEMLQGELYEIRGITAAEGVNPEELGDFLTKTDAAATYLPLIGGTLTGHLSMDGTSVIKTRHLDSGNNSDLNIKRNGVRMILVGSDKISFDKVPTYGENPSGDNHLTRKKWVSDNFSAVGHGHTGYSPSNHNHNGTYVKGNYTISEANGNYYIS